MPRFYFHLLGNDPNIYDDTGMELPDVCAARAVASETARTIIEEARDAGQALDLRCYFEICDGKNEIVDVISFRSAAKLVQ